MSPCGWTAWSTRAVAGITPFTLTFHGQPAGDGDRVEVDGAPTVAHTRLTWGGQTWVQQWPWDEFVNRAASIGLEWEDQPIPDS